MVRKANSAPAPASRTKAAAPVQRARQEVRIIGGSWKRTPLLVLDRPGLRPTPNRVRETLFNWLGGDLTGWSCIDAFAGSGALGFEAASRGAREVMLVEQDAALIGPLRSLQARLGATTVRVMHADGIAVLRGCAEGSSDLVFLDPPFDSTRYDEALQAAARALAPQGLVYLEAATAWAPPRLQALGLSLHRQLKAGAVVAHLLKREPLRHA
ncbi:MAG: 16S rRNA (guanine(966)-N(2))-methyltransferase RsmD [Burkholderiaceae bacterium]